MVTTTHKKTASDELAAGQRTGNLQIITPSIQRFTLSCNTPGSFPLSWVGYQKEGRNENQEIQKTTVKRVIGSQPTVGAAPPAISKTSAG